MDPAGFVIFSQNRANLVCSPTPAASGLNGRIGKVPDWRDGARIFEALRRSLSGAKPPQIKHFSNWFQVAVPITIPAKGNHGRNPRHA